MKNCLFKGALIVDIKLVKKRQNLFKNYKTSNSQHEEGFNQHYFVSHLCISLSTPYKSYIITFCIGKQTQTPYNKKLKRIKTQ